MTPLVKTVKKRLYKGQIILQSGKPALFYKIAY